MSVDLLKTYAVIGVDAGATKEVVVAAMRQLRSAWHPDRNNDDDAKERIAGLNEAVGCDKAAGYPPASSTIAQAQPGAFVRAYMRERGASPAEDEAKAVGEVWRWWKQRGSVVATSASARSKKGKGEKS